MFRKERAFPYFNDKKKKKKKKGKFFSKGTKRTQSLSLSFEVLVFSRWFVYLKKIFAQLSEIDSLFRNYFAYIREMGSLILHKFFATKISLFYYCLSKNTSMFLQRSKISENVESSLSRRSVLHLEKITLSTHHLLERSV